MIVPTTVDSRETEKVKSGFGYFSNVLKTRVGINDFTNKLQFVVSDKRDEEP